MRQHHRAEARLIFVRCCHASSAGAHHLVLIVTQTGDGADLFPYGRL
jgi:hypothetical protein